MNLSSLARIARVARGLLPMVMLVSCGDRDLRTEPAAFRVALLLAGPENDEGWNQSAFEGLQRIERELGATVRKVTATNATEIDQALAAAAKNGFTLVFGHGFEFNAPAAKAAAAFPEVSFATTGGTATAANLATLVLRNEEASYQLGVLAGHLTRSGVLSSLHGEAFEPVKRVAAAFASGARSVRADVRILEEYLGSWEDAVLAKEKALAHAAAGADVFFQNADAAGAGIFEACRTKGALAFGCNRDQTAKAPDVVVASAVAEIPKLMIELATEARAGRFHGGARSFGLAEGDVRIAFNPALADRVPAAARAAMETAAAAIVSGKLVVGAP